MTSFENCPNDWTLTGGWQCGVPENVGPSAAFDRTQCLGTQIAANYTALQTWAGTTATSPDIDLTGLTNTTVTFRMRVDTGVSTCDGANLMISTDGGANYSVVTSVAPAYPLTISRQPAWGGHQSALGWQLAQADLSAYAGNIVRLRLAFQSDSSGNYAGFYVFSFSVQCPRIRLGPRNAEPEFSDCLWAVESVDEDAVRYTVVGSLAESLAVYSCPPPMTVAVF